MNYIVKAPVTVNVEMEIEAVSQDEAIATFKDSLALNAVLLDVDPTQWDTIEDSISDVGPVFVEVAKETESAA